MLVQAKFAFNSMVNKSIGRAPFAIVYAKVPQFPTDLVDVVLFKNNFFYYN